MEEPKTDIPERKAASGETDLNKLIARWESCRKSMEKAEGTRDYPRLAIEHDMAGMAYKMASMEMELGELRKVNAEQRTELAKAQESMDYIKDLHANTIDSMAKRLLIIESAYAHMQLQVQSNTYVDNLLKAYQMGKKAQEPDAK